jgi:hypothetical protein|tara:strand:+ start:78 stop:377 length:300 start_codon:yes stop_codon:yes gene_type:complete
MEEFKKFDGGKTRYDLVPPKIIQGIAEVLTFGANKYGANNWKSVDDPERYVGALYRHLEAYRRGEFIDPESGFSHLEHASTNLAFLIELGHESTNWSKE